MGSVLLVPSGDYLFHGIWPSIEGEFESKKIILYNRYPHYSGENFVPVGYGDKEICLHDKYNHIFNQLLLQKNYLKKLVFFAKSFSYLSDYRKDLNLILESESIDAIVLFTEFSIPSVIIKQWADVHNKPIWFVQDSLLDNTISKRILRFRVSTYKIFNFLLRQKFFPTAYNIGSEKNYSRLYYWGPAFASNNGINSVSKKVCYYKFQLFGKSEIVPNQLAIVLPIMAEVPISIGYLNEILVLFLNSSNYSRFIIKFHPREHKDVRQKFLDSLCIKNFSVVTDDSEIFNSGIVLGAESMLSVKCVLNSQRIILINNLKLDRIFEHEVFFKGLVLGNYKDWGAYLEEFTKYTSTYPYLRRNFLDNYFVGY